MVHGWCKHLDFKIGITLQTSSLYFCDTEDYQNFNTTGISGFHMDVCHHHGLGEKNTANGIKYHKDTVTDISLPLHEALTLMNYTYKNGCMSSNQLEHLPVTPGFCMPVLA